MGVLALPLRHAGYAGDLWLVIGRRKGEPWYLMMKLGQDLLPSGEEGIALEREGAEGRPAGAGGRHNLIHRFLSFFLLAWQQTQFLSAQTEEIAELAPEIRTRRTDATLPAADTVSCDV